MAISEDEAERLIQHLETTIREFAGQPETQGIVNLLNQWRSDVEAGRPIERKLAARQSPGIDELTDVPRTRTTTSGDFVGKEDYSKAEQLDMLVSALGVAFVAPQMMARRFLAMIESSAGQAGAKMAHNPEIHLVGVGDTDEVEAAPSISWATVTQSHLVTIDLGRLLDEISREGELTPRRLTNDQEVG